MGRSWLLNSTSTRAIRNGTRPSILGSSADQDIIESELDNVVWEQLPDKRACRTKVAQPIDYHIEGLSAMQRESLIEWAVREMDAFRDVFELRL